MNWRGIWIVGTMVMACGLASQGAEMPSAHERLKPLEWHVGDWVTEYQATSDTGPIKKGDMVKVQFSIRWSPDRSSMVNNSYSEVRGKRIATGLEVIAWDYNKSIVSHSYFGTWGTGHGVWTRVGDQPELEWTIQGPHGTFKGTSYAWRDGDVWKWQIRNQTRDGQPMPDMPAATFVREKGAPAAAAGDAVPPGEVQKYFDFLAGDWKVDGTVDGKKFTSDTSFQRAPGKHALVCHWDGEFGGQPVHGAAILGWDAKAKQVVDFGFIRELGWRALRYMPKNAGVWEGDIEGVIRGGEVSAKVRVEPTDNDSFRLTSAAGPNNPDQEYRFRKVKGEKPNESLPPQAHETPSCRQDLKDLGAVLVGDWEGESVPWVDEAKDTKKAKRTLLRCSFRWILNGAAVEEKGSVPGGEFRGLDVWDADAKRIRRSVVDSSGGTSAGTIVRRSGAWVFQESYVSADGETRRSHTATITVGADGDTVTFVHGPVVIDGRPQKGYQDVFKRVRK